MHKLDNIADKAINHITKAESETCKALGVLEKLQKTATTDPDMSIWFFDRLETIYSSALWTSENAKRIYKKLESLESMLEEQNAE